MKRAVLSVIGPKKEGEPEFTNLELSRFIAHIENRLTTIVRWAAGVVGLLVLGVSLFAIVTWQQDDRRVHDQCVSSNHGRAEIKQAFGDLYDSFVAVSPPDKKPLAVLFKKDRMKALDKGLPQRVCK